MGEAASEVRERAAARLVQEALELLEAGKQEEAASLLRVALERLGGPVEVRLGQDHPQV